MWLLDLIWTWVVIVASSAMFAFWSIAVYKLIAQRVSSGPPGQPSATRTTWRAKPTGPAIHPLFPPEFST